MVRPLLVRVEVWGHSPSPVGKLDVMSSSAYG